MESSSPPTKSQRKGESFHARSYRMFFYFFLNVFVFALLFFHHPRDRWEEEFESEKSYLKTSAAAAAAWNQQSEPSSSSTTTITQQQQQSQSQQQDFRVIAHSTGTDKVAGYHHLPICLKDTSGKSCTHPTAPRETCRPWGHFYDTIYNRWLGKYSSENAEPMQFLEIGYFQGKGFEAYSQFLPTAEKHSMEISCIPEGPREEGKWPWGNFAKKHSWYQGLLDAKRLHCGDASDLSFLKKIWTTEMKRPDAPPLMAVIDDGAHLHDQMAATLFFWFPRIQPGGILVVEDIQPIPAANKFRTHIVPQVMKDLHWCGGDPDVSVPDSLCFPTIQPLLQGVHCEMHICVFVRNDAPAYEPDEAASRTPPNAFTGAEKCLFGPHV